jgi:hypothetical protein
MVGLVAWEKVNEEWFVKMYGLSSTDEQFLWQKAIVFDQLYGRFPAPGAFEKWACGRALPFGIVKDGSVYGAGCLCNIDVVNNTCEVKILIDPAVRLTPGSMREVINQIIGFAFSQGIERVYGYWPRTESRVSLLWERVIKKIARRVGLEKHAIRTAKRLLGRIQFEVIRS